MVVFVSTTHTRAWSNSLYSVLKRHEAADYAETYTSNWMILKRKNVPLKNVFGEAQLFFPFFFGI